MTAAVADSAPQGSINGRSGCTTSSRNPATAYVRDMRQGAGRRVGCAEEKRR